MAPLERRYVAARVVVKGAPVQGLWGYQTGRNGSILVALAPETSNSPESLEDHLPIQEGPNEVFLWDRSAALARSTFQAAAPIQQVYTDHRVHYWEATVSLVCCLLALGSPQPACLHLWHPPEVGRPSCRHCDLRHCDLQCCRYCERS